MSLTIGSLFSGVGGLDLGVKSVLDAEVIWHSEVADAPSRVLARHWPDVPNLGDITAVDWSTVPRVDVLTGGSPCQDVSSAGKRAGMAEGTRSNLWVVMRDAIEHLRPSLVVWENVRGALSARAASDLESREGCVGEAGGPALRAVGRVLGDLADLGYDAEWVGLRAADVGAPHARFRIFVFASPADAEGDSRWLIDRDDATPADAAGLGLAGADQCGRDDTELTATPVGRPTTADDTGERWSGRRDASDTRIAIHAASGGESAGQLGRPHVAERGSSSSNGTTRWGPYTPAIARWEAVLGRHAPDPTETGPRGGQRLSARFSEWMMGYPAGWITDTPGITRNEALKAAGNGVVPAQAAAATQWFLRRRAELGRWVA